MAVIPAQKILFLHVFLAVFPYRYVLVIGTADGCPYFHDTRITALFPDRQFFTTACLLYRRPAKFKRFSVFQA
jgi:hypothetical protein